MANSALTTSSAFSAPDRFPLLTSFCRHIIYTLPALLFHVVYRSSLALHCIAYIHLQRQAGSGEGISRASFPECCSEALDRFPRSAMDGVRMRRGAAGRVNPRSRSSHLPKLTLAQSLLKLRSQSLSARQPSERGSFHPPSLSFELHDLLHRALRRWFAVLRKNGDQLYAPSLLRPCGRAITCALRDEEGSPLPYHHWVVLGVHPLHSQQACRWLAPREIPLRTQAAEPLRLLTSDVRSHSSATASVSYDAKHFKQSATLTSSPGDWETCSIFGRNAGVALDWHEIFHFLRRTRRAIRGFTSVRRLVFDVKRRRRSALQPRQTSCRSRCLHQHLAPRLHPDRSRCASGRRQQLRGLLPNVHNEVGERLWVAMPERPMPARLVQLRVHAQSSDRDMRQYGYGHLQLARIYISISSTG